MKNFKRLFKLIGDAGNAFLDDEGFKLSASLSYYMIFALGPVLIIIISLAGMFFGDGRAGVQGEVYEQLNVIVGADTALQIQNISLKNKRLARMIKKCREIPGRELFQYFDAEGNRKSIDSGMVNRYIKDATGGDFSAKDFRTWAGTLNILRAFKTIGLADSESDPKKNIVAALDEVSKQLGNTRTVCKKYYVHPGIIRLYEEKNLSKYINELDEIEESDNLTGLTSDERVLMKILKQLV